MNATQPKGSCSPSAGRSSARPRRYYLKMKSQSNILKKVDQYCRGCKAEVYAGICRPWLYLTFRSGGMFDGLFFNLAGGLFGAFGILDIVGRWGRVAPMKKKSFDLKKDGGECPELVLSPQVIPNSYLDLSFPRSASKRSRATSRVGITNYLRSAWCVR